MDSDRTRRLDAIIRCSRALLKRLTAGAVDGDKTARPSGSVEVEGMV